MTAGLPRMDSDIGGCLSRLARIPTEVCYRNHDCSSMNARAMQIVV